MYFKQIYDPDLAQASYLIGCQATGDAIVVDARRDVDSYLELAARNGLRITAVTETHIHADYLSGSRELAAATGATLYLSDEGNADWKYGFDGVRLHHGDRIPIGNVTATAVHTPGHTPEHLSFLITDGATTDRPGFFLTGDFVFVGDIGRPDLLDEAAGGVDTRFEGARRMFASLRDHFLTLPDYVQVWPGHGAGSACGKALGAVASSTVGYERRFAWWSSYLESGDEDGFVTALLEGQPDAPLYFGRMKRLNKSGPTVLGKRPELVLYDPRELNPRINRELVLIDTRATASYGADAVAGSINVPDGDTFATYASYVIDPDRETRPIVLLAADGAHARSLRDKLSYVGIDNVSGYITTVAGLDRAPVASVSPGDLGQLEDPFILDVRTANEYAAGHLPGATQLHAGRLLWNLEALPRDRVIVSYCQSGARNSVASSALRAAGFDNVVELEGSYLAWKAAQDLTPA